MLSAKSYLILDASKWPRNLRFEPGVYEIVALDGTSATRTIHRAGGIDTRDVLYIGQSQDLRRRLDRLRRGLADGKLKKHIAGRTYRVRPAIQAIAPIRSLGFRYEHCDDPSSREKQRLARYICKFGEAPPLNAQA